jgi:DNA-binding NarL/FixJ family response regulator
MDTPHTPVRLVIVEDHRSFRELLSRAFGTMAGFEVVGIATTGKEALTVCETVHPDVVILDIMLPDMNGLDCVPFIRRKSPQAKILIFSGSTGAVFVSRAVAQGVDGYIEKGASFSDLVEAVKTVDSGRSYFGEAIKPVLRNIKKSPFPLDAIDRLTLRERNILGGIAAGKSSKTIAGELGLSLFTVNNHRRRIKNKTGLRSTSDLTLHALSLGLVEEQAHMAVLTRS